MKYSLLILSMIIFISGFSQTASFPTNENGDIEYSGIVTVNNTDSVQLFSRAKSFMSSAFESGKAVTDMTDDATKKIIAKGWFPVDMHFNLYGNAHFKAWLTLTIQCKTDRYRYVVNNIEVASQYGTLQPETKTPITNEKPKSLPKKHWQELTEQIRSGIEAMIKDMQQKMAVNTDNW